MAIESVGRVGETEGALRQQTSLQLEDFLNIFLTQLSFQDPLEPVDNREFLAQLAQFSSLELANSSNENSEGLLEVTSYSQSIGLLGRSVEANTENGTVTGEVIAMRLSGAQPQLTLREGDGTVTFVSPAQVSLVTQLGGE